MYHWLAVVSQACLNSVADCRPDGHGAGHRLPEQSGGQLAGLERLLLPREAVREWRGERAGHQSAAVVLRRNYKKIAAELTSSSGHRGEANAAALPY